MREDKNSDKTRQGKYVFNAHHDAKINETSKTPHKDIESQDETRQSTKTDTRQKTENKSNAR